MEEVLAPSKWKREDQEAKHSHFEYEQGKNLYIRELGQQDKPMNSKES
jgi:hypothetical protein